jgi:hypothetical protein
VHVISEFKSARYWSIEVDDTTNADTYVQIGRVFVGGGLLPAKNIFLRARWTAGRTPSSIVRSESGAEYAVVLPKLRVTRFRLDWLTPAESEYVHEMLRRLGTTGEVLYVPDANDADAQQRYGFLGRLRELSAIEYPYVSTRAIALEIAEILS